MRAAVFAVKFRAEIGACRTHRLAEGGGLQVKEVKHCGCVPKIIYNARILCTFFIKITEHPVRIGKVVVKSFHVGVNAHKLKGKGGTVGFCTRIGVKRGRNGFANGQWGQTVVDVKSLYHFAVEVENKLRIVHIPPLFAVGGDAQPGIRRCGGDIKGKPRVCVLALPPGFAVFEGSHGGNIGNNIVGFICRGHSADIFNGGEKNGLILL